MVDCLVSFNSTDGVSTTTVPNELFKTLNATNEGFFLSAFQLSASRNANASSIFPFTGRFSMQRIKTIIGFTKSRREFFQLRPEWRIFNMHNTISTNYRIFILVVFKLSTNSRPLNFTPKRHNNHVKHSKTFILVANICSRS